MLLDDSGEFCDSAVVGFKICDGEPQWNLCRSAIVRFGEAGTLPNRIQA